MASSAISSRNALGRSYGGSADIWSRHRVSITAGVYVGRRPERAMALLGVSLCRTCLDAEMHQLPDHQTLFDLGTAGEPRHALRHRTKPLGKLVDDDLTLAHVPHPPARQRVTPPSAIQSGAGPKDLGNGAGGIRHQQYLDKNPAGYCGIGGTGVKLSAPSETNWGRSCPTGIAPAPEGAEE
ncbi:hypothetical protein Stsp01_30250 [Streptomyces sp. NBRC 13847]|nr:hypothetical protein Stsp01_30250 [Streptomyces sp. NBRC 13847]